MSVTWRGFVNLVQRTGYLRADVVEARVRYEVYDDGDPGTVLESASRRHLWPLDAFQGLSPAQIGDLVLNQGLQGEGDPSLPPPPPDPPPLSQEGQEMFEDWVAGRVFLDLPLPKEFSP